MLFYNFNDYGQKQAQAAPTQADLPLTQPSDRVPSRQVTRGGSRRGTRGSSIGQRGHTRGKDGDESSPQPGMMTNPNEFGPPVQVRQQSVVSQNSVAQQIQSVQQVAGGPPTNRIHRLGSPFHDYNRKKGIQAGGRHKHGKVVLPSLPQKSDGNGKSGEGANRSPMRTTSFGVIMEMIKEEEP